LLIANSRTDVDWAMTQKTPSSAEWQSDRELFPLRLA
jgi:hypothetical protein